MKFIVAVVCIVVFATFAHGVSIKEMLTAVRECKEQHNCMETIDEVLQTHNIPQTTEGLETMYCFCEKLGMISDNKINPEVMTEILGKMNVEHPTSITAACQYKCTSANHAEAAKSLINCILKETSNFSEGY